MTPLLALVIAAALAVTLTPLVSRLAQKFGVMDVPGPLKVQREPVPYLGGLAVFLSILPFLYRRPVLALPLLTALLLGLGDDTRELPPWARLAGQAVAGLMAAAVVPSPVSTPIWWATGAFLVPALANAVNLIDGLDAIASGVVAAGAAGFAVVLGGSGELLAAALFGGLCGFLVHNAPPARIYLGDAGSYMLGAALTVLLLSAWSGAGSAAAVLAPAGFVVVPVGEVAVAVIRRWRAGQPLFAGDRGHVYDQLVARGFSVTRAAATCITAQALLSAVAVVAHERPTPAAVTLLTIGAAAVAAPVALGGFLSPNYSKGS